MLLSHVKLLKAASFTDPLTVEELCGRGNLPETTGHRQMPRLLDAGFVGLRFGLSGKGRPCRKYVLTDDGFEAIKQFDESGGEPSNQGRHSPPPDSDHQT